MQSDNWATYYVCFCILIFLNNIERRAVSVKQLSFLFVQTLPRITLCVRAASVHQLQTATCPVINFMF